MESERSIPALALVGMAGRFPGGEGLGDFWSLLQQGRSAVRRLSDQELRQAGVAESWIADPSYVKCCVPLDGADLFDAGFFGYSPRQAANLDPQHRLFLECAWEALERAGYGAIPSGVTAGVFGGSGYNGYLLQSLQEDRRSDPGNVPQSIVDADKDFMTGRVAYKLGLTGPAITIQTGCSTSLVAVHLASQSLLSYECDIALAGGSSVLIPPHTGYPHVEGGIQSRDGACRAFEADASGTIRGSGTGVVVLKRLEDAERDGDTVLAIIRSTAVNNDGSRKVGFTAPGLEAQVRVLRTGLELAGLTPSDIDFVEAHGTATALGDSIELTALQEVYASRQGRRQPCVLGAVKTNIGHTDTAAGIAGLIKTVLSLRHQVYLPNAGVRRPNAMLAAEQSVFRICAAAEPWLAEAGRPRRAAVSSFGIGGTNAHVIVEEAAETSHELAEDQAEWLPLSARSQAALEQSSLALAAHLEAHAVIVPDVAFTLQVGRRAHDHRRFVVGAGRSEITAALRIPSQRQHAVPAATLRPVIFLFPGQGAQRHGMVADLYATDREFAVDLDRCAQAALALQADDLRGVLCHRDGSSGLDINDTAVTQPALFIAEYCLARFWMRQGLMPAAVLGHSVGEYAAACIAGVMGFDDALRLVVHRGRACQQLPEGAMVAVNLPEADVKRLLIPSVEIAALNAARQCVVSGLLQVMQEFMARLDARGIEYQRLAVSRPFHTEAATPLADGMLQLARQSTLAVPRVPWISSVTATRMSESESCDPAHWARHILKPVRFAAALRALTTWEHNALLEVGPGRVLTSLARSELGASSLYLSLPPAGRATRADLLSTLGAMWVAGADIDFAAQTRRGRRRVDLPPHPLERSGYLKRAPAARELQSRRAGVRLPPDLWFNLPGWQRSLLPAPASYDASAGAWLLLADEQGFADLLAERLRAAGQEALCVRLSDSCEGLEDVFARADREKRRIGRIVHCATLSERYTGVAWFPSLARVLSARNEGRPLSLLVLTQRLHDISGHENSCPERAALQVFCRCLAQEVPHLRCIVVDLPTLAADRVLVEQYARYADRVLSEIESGTDATVAYRGRWRFVQSHSPLELTSDARSLRELRDRGLYLITGALGRLGLALAERLARDCRARLLLIARGSFPERSQWEAVADSAASWPASTAERVRKLLHLESLGAEVTVATLDIADEDALSDAIMRAEQQMGPVRGVFHLAADLAHPSRQRRIAELSHADLAAQMRPKSEGLLALLGALGSRPLDFGIAFSSTSTLLGGLGFAAYAAANAVMDSLIASGADARLAPWISVSWDGWLTPGVPPDPYTIGIEEGLAALSRIWRLIDVPQVIVSSTPIEPRLETWVRPKRTSRPASHASTGGAQDTDASAAVLPRSPLERQIADIWQELLGVETVGVTESFLTLGGDSLIGVRVISRIKESFQVVLPPASLLGEHSTVEALSRDIVRAMAIDASRS